MLITLIVLVLSIIFFVSGKVRSDLVALCALIALLVTNILTPAEGLAGFSNTTVIMMVGLFVVGGGILQTGLAKMISSKILKLAGKSEMKLFLLVVITTACIGAFVSNTGTVALLLPIVVSMAVSANSNASRLLMPLAFASSMGGMLTLIGTPPNLIINDALVGAGYDSLKFFTFLPVGVICVIVGILVLIPLSKAFLSKRGKKQDDGSANKSLDELVSEYGLSDNLHRVRIPEHSPIINQTLAGLDLRRKYGLNILEIRRPQSNIMSSVKQFTSPDTRLQDGDILYLSGAAEKIKGFLSDYGLEGMGGRKGENPKSDDTSLDFYDIGIAEVLLMAPSRLMNQTVREAAFRELYNVNVLGIKRKNVYITQKLGDVHFQDGDVLLVHGDWKDIGRLSGSDENWVVLGQPLEQAAKVTLDYKAPIAAFVLVLMVLMMVFDFIPVQPVTAVLIAAVLMVITGCVRGMDAAYKTINWQTIVLFAAMMPMSTALEKTGISNFVAGFLVDTLGGVGPFALLAGIYFTTSIMTLFISNTVTALLMAPIALQSALTLGVSPVPLLFAVTVAASMCFASPFSTPPNALVMSAGNYTFMDYVKVGLPLQLIMGVVMIFALPLLFPF